MDIAILGNTVWPKYEALPRWPRPGESLLVTRYTEATLGGNGVCVAMGLAALGCSVCLVTAVANDDGGRFLRKALKHKSLDGRLELRAVQLSEQHNTPVAYYTGGEEPSFFCLVGASVELTPERILEACEHRLHRGAPRVPLLGVAGWVVVAGLGVLPGLHSKDSIDRLVENVLSEARRDGRQLYVAVDVNLQPASDDAWQEILKVLGPYVDVFAPNFAEARQVLGEPRRKAFEEEAGARSEEAVLEEAALLARRIRKEFAVRNVVVVKCREYGCVVAMEEGVFHVPATPCPQRVDSVGAGDAWLSGFVATMVGGGSVFQREAVLRACRAGNQCAALALRFRGATEWTLRYESLLKQDGR
ncbi:MAG: carbohydrate kinase family protein [Dehalococcoidia bacterium]